MPTYKVLSRGSQDDFRDEATHLSLEPAVQDAEDRARASPRRSFFVMKVERSANEIREATGTLRRE